MLSALGLGGSKKRWTPASKLQKDGKMAKKALIEYLEFGAQQIASADSMEHLARMAKDKPDDSKFIDVINDWQCQLIEHKGYDLNFGRMSLDEWKTGAGAAGSPKSDPKVIEAFDRFAKAIEITLMLSVQVAQMRETLQLGDDGKSSEDALMPRRSPTCDGKVQTVGPIPRQKMIKFCEMARDLVLSLKTRELLGELMKEYATWKQESLMDLLNKVILNWQYELWDSPEIAVDHRLGVLELSRFQATSEKDDLMIAQKNMFMACQALTAWFSVKPSKDALPRSEGRQYEPFSLADESFKEERAGALFSEGDLGEDKFFKIVRKVVDTASTDEYASTVERLALASDPADLRVPERLMFELYEACGIEHRFATMLLIYYSGSEQSEKLTADMTNAQKGIKMKLMLGLRKAQEAKKPKEAEAEKGN